MLYTHHTYPLHSVARRIGAFAHRHEDIPAFHAAFLVAVFLAAALFSLGAFGVVILACIGADVFKYGRGNRASVRTVLHGVFHENVLDVTLFFSALAFGLYLHPMFLLPIFPFFDESVLWLLRAVPVLAVKIHILEHAFHKAVHAQAYLRTPHPALRGDASRLHALLSVVLCIGIALIVVSPWLFALAGAADGQWAGLLAKELTPWRL